MKSLSKTVDGRSFILSSIFFLCCLCFLASIYEFRFHSLSTFSQYSFNVFLNNTNGNTTNDIIPSQENDNEIRIFIGILTLPDQYHKRHFLRMIYGTQRVPNATIDVKFVFCNLTKDEQRVLVALEIMRYDDILILNCTENMNEGKTYTYFSSLPQMLLNDDENNRRFPPYHYVMKADDDTFFRIESLVDSLRPLPREDMYYGYVIPCGSMDPFHDYMSGMGFLVSWDLVEWISESDIPKNKVVGPEDMMFGEWLREGHKAKNRYNMKWAMYNFPDPPDICTHELWPDTIAVHLLKNPDRWIRTLKYFNFTNNLKPSKLYHI